MIVAMCWGRPSEIVVYDLDDNGELVPARTIKNGEPDPERRWFTCRIEVWRTLQDVAKEHGWVPEGTSLSPKAERWDTVNAELANRGILSSASAAARHSRLQRAKLDVGYEPEEWAYAKLVSHADAAAMADALDRSLAEATWDEEERRIVGPTYIREVMTREEFIAANRAPSAPLVREFVAFLRRGPFKFAWDGD